MLICHALLLWATLLVCVFAAPSTTPNYDILNDAVKRYNNIVPPELRWELKLGGVYMLTETEGWHHKFIVGKVRFEDDTLHWDAHMTHLRKDGRKLCIRGPLSIFFGADVLVRPIRRYQCDSMARYRAPAKAKPEFADWRFVKALGDVVVEKRPDFNVFTNNCRHFVEEAYNLAKMEESAVDETQRCDSVVEPLNE